jgi:DNA-binding MarR family transcriptional regulator
MAPLPATKILDKLLADAGVAGAHGFEVLRLVRAVDHAYDRLLHEVTRDGPVTAPRWRILLRLWVEEQLGQGAVNPTHLSRTQQVAKNTISDHLRALEESGLIERELDQEDRRQFKIHLTEAGRAIVQKYTPLHARYLNQPLASFTSQEIAQLQRLLSKLHGALLAEIGGCPCAVEPEQEAPDHTVE